ncbi:hypothetical protein C7U57_24505 [Pseudomonas sp. R9.37]|nr:hypothetical protein C7U57_24505 [Pseudomonas sp. R9.37]
MGAGLLANAVYQSTYLLTDTPLSRASPLPQLFCVCSENLIRHPTYFPFSLAPRDWIPRTRPSAQEPVHDRNADQSRPQPARH